MRIVKALVPAIMVFAFIFTCCWAASGAPAAGSTDNDLLPEYMQDWELMEPVFDPLSEELGNYVIHWDWKQDEAEGVVYYLEEASTSDFLNANVTTHLETKVLMTGKPNGTYWYRVRAVKGNLTSVWSTPDMVKISIEPINPPDSGIIIHDYHKDTYERLFEWDSYYQKEKLEFFLNVPMLVQVGDADDAPRYWMTLRECHTSAFYNVSVIEIQDPHQFITITSDISTIDIDQDGVDDLEVQFNKQHANGQVYIKFLIIDHSGPVIPYHYLGVVLAGLLIVVYYVYRRKRSSRPPGDSTEADIVEAEPPEGETEIQDIKEEGVEENER